MDRIDLVIKEYFNGMLDLKIKALSHKKQCSNVSNQLIEKLKFHREIMNEICTAIKGEMIEKILIARYKYHLTWIQVGIRLSIEESTARKHYRKFKSELRKLLFEAL